MLIRLEYHTWVCKNLMRFCKEKERQILKESKLQIGPCKWNLVSSAQPGKIFIITSVCAYMNVSKNLSWVLKRLKN